MNKAFTFTEVMIVVVIVGLLLAMAIPAIEHVRMHSIEKLVVDGKATREQRHEYEEWTRNRKADTQERLDKLRYEVEEKTREMGSAVISPDSISLQTLKVNGKTYFLLPKQDLQETTIAGQTYWLVPAP